MTAPAPINPISIDLTKVKNYVIAITPIFFMIFSHFFNVSNINAIETRVTAIENSPTISSEMVNGLIGDVTQAFETKRKVAPAPRHKTPKGANGPTQPK